MFSELVIIGYRDASGNDDDNKLTYYSIRIG